MKPKHYVVRADELKLSLSESELRKIMRDALWGSVGASSAIEGEDFSMVRPPDASTIPVSLLTTRPTPQNENHS